MTHKKFEAHWVSGYVCNGEKKILSLEDIRDGNGYDEDVRESVRKLKVGDKLDVFGVFDHMTLTRIA